MMADGSQLPIADPAIPFRVSDATRIATVCDRVDMLVRLSWLGLSGMMTIGVGIIITLLFR